MKSEAWAPYEPTAADAWDLRKWLTCIAAPDSSYVE